MRITLLWMALILSTNALFSSAQEKGKALIKGRVVDDDLSQDKDIEVSIPYMKLLSKTDREGNFVFPEVPYGSYMLVFNNYLFTDTIRILVNESMVDLGDLWIKLPEVPLHPENILPPAQEEAEETSDDEEHDSRKVSSLLSAGRDPFQNTVAFTFGAYRFRARGYKSNTQQVFINGALMNDMESGDAYWGLWGGLNDVFRKKQISYGLAASEYAFGGLNGAVYLDAAAASQRKQSRITYSLTNRIYRNRIMLSHSSGLLKGGFAYSVSVSKRWSNEGYIDGTFYDAYSYYASVSKQFGRARIFSLTVFGAPAKRGKSGPVTAEVMDLTASARYNPYWGYQDGKKRNARIAESHQPVFIFSHEYRSSDKLRWNTGISYQSGKNSGSAIDWYKGADPRPDYYRYLPSWQLQLYDDDSAFAALRSQSLTEEWRNDPEKRQIDWERLYNVNYANLETIRNINGNPADSLTGHRSVYVQSADVDAVRKLGFNTHLQMMCNDHITVYAGFNYSVQRMESYKQLMDLLGGDFFVDLNQFAETNYPGNIIFNQNDLDHPDRIIYKGNKYAYDYIAHFTKGGLWAQVLLTYRHIDFFITAAYGRTSFYREGLFRNGLYPQDSYGKSNVSYFSTPGIKGGLTYKFNGRNYLFLNAGMSQEPPVFDNVYVSPRIRNLIINTPAEQKTYTLEGGYLLRTPRFNGRMIGYATDIKGATEIKRFYNDDGRFQSFVNYVLQNVDLRFTGVEFALDAKLSTSLNVTGVAAVGEAFYTARPRVSVYKDNDTGVTPVSRIVYLKNYYLGIGPQSAYSLAFNYHSRQYWYATISFSYFDRNYIDVAPDRRSQEAADHVTAGSEEYRRIFDQEQLPAFFTADVFIGKSFLLSKMLRFLPRNTYLYLNLGINNLMDKRDIVTGGFEQLRYDFKSDTPSTFPARYFYGSGRNYFLNLSLKI